MPFGLSSGAAAIFGVTGGVTEAVLRRLVHSSRMEDLQDISFTGIRGIEGIKEASIQLEDRTVKIAVVNGLRCAETLLERIKAGEVQYDFVEVMACKRGCIAGGGQPVPIGPRTKQARLDGMYKIDSMAQIKQTYGQALCVDDAFWQAKAECSFATLISIGHLFVFPPFSIAFRNRRSWVDLGSFTGQSTSAGGHLETHCST